MARSLVLVAALVVPGCGGFSAIEDDGGGDLGGGNGGVEVLAGDRAASADLTVGSGYVYWVDEGTSAHGDGKVMRVPVGGCAGQSPPACPTVLADKRNAPTAIALSLDATTLLWTELQDAKGDLTDGGVFALDLTLVAGNMVGTPMQLASQQDGPEKIAVDDSALYWINYNSGELRRMYLDGGTPNGLPIAQPASPSGLAVDPGAQRIYVTTSGSNGTDGLLIAFGVDGKNAVTVASSLHDPRGLALGPTYVYWVNTADGTLLHARTDGSDFGPSASNRATPRAVALDADRIYWVEAGTAPYYTDGRVGSCKLDGSDLRVLADHRSYPRNLALDDKYVYWVDRGTAGGDMYDGAVLRVEKVPAQ